MQAVAKKAHEHAKTAGEQVDRFEAEYVIEMRRGQDEVCELTMPLCHQAFIAAVRFKMLMAVYPELESCKEKEEYLNEVLKWAGRRSLVWNQWLRIRRAG